MSMEERQRELPLAALLGLLVLWQGLELQRPRGEGKCAGEKT